MEPCASFTTIGVPVYVLSTNVGVDLRVDGVRFATLVAVKREVPTPTGSAFGAVVDQS